MKMAAIWYKEDGERLEKAMSFRRRATVVVRKPMSGVDGKHERCVVHPGEVFHTHRAWCYERGSVAIPLIDVDVKESIFCTFLFRESHVGGYAPFAWDIEQ